MKRKNRITYLVLPLVCGLILLLPPLQAEEIGSDIRSITVLPPADNSGFNIGPTLQQSMGEYLYETRQFVVQYSGHALSGFTAKDLYQTFERLDSQLLIFAYVEPQRMSLFLFDSYRPQEFVAATVPFPQPDEKNPLTPEVVITTFPAAFDVLMSQFVQGLYQPLPGAEVTKKVAVDDTTLTRKLFRELSSATSSAYFAGANIGVARMAANAKDASTVNLSIYGGYRLSEEMKFELGVDLFSYAFANAKLHYELPYFNDKYLSLSVLGSAGMVLGTIADHRGFDSSNIPNGSLLFGAGLGLHVPLAGADVVCEVRFYMGAGSLLFGTYGLSYAL